MRLERVLKQYDGKAIYQEVPVRFLSKSQHGVEFSFEVKRRKTGSFELSNRYFS